MTLVKTDPHDEAHLWRARMGAGLSAEEERNFERWIAADPYHGEAFAEAEVIWGALGRIEYSVVHEPAANAATPALASSWFEQVGEYLRETWGKIAAASTVVTAAAILFFIAVPIEQGDKLGPETQRFVTQANAARFIKLPDKSSIRLAPDSELTVRYSEDSRDIALLSGSARFDVASDLQRPFIVATDIANVQVTGTRFVTKLRDGGLEVAVTKGSVNVAATDNGIDAKTSSPPIALSAGQAIWTADGVAFVDVEFPKAAPRRSAAASGNSVPQANARQTYVRAPLSQVIADINRYGDAAITVEPAAAELRLSGTFDIGDSNATIAIIEEALPVTMIDRDGQLTIIHD
ncbi:MAG: FecR domain-containing protein [Pseudomonadota bacterium]